MNSTDEAILTFAEAFSRLGDRKHRDLYVEALASIVRMAKAEERYAAQLSQDAASGDAGRHPLAAEAAAAVLLH